MSAEQNTVQDVGRMLAESVAGHLQAQRQQMNDEELCRYAAELRKQAGSLRATESEMMRTAEDAKDPRKNKEGKRETAGERHERQRIQDELRQGARKLDAEAQGIEDGVAARKVAAARAEDERRRENGQTISVITVDAAKVRDAAQKVGRHCCTKSSLPILNMLMIRANGRVVIDAAARKDETPTHAEIEAAEPAPSSNDGQGGAVVAPGLLTRVLKCFTGLATLRIYDVPGTKQGRGKEQVERMLDVYTGERQRLVSLRAIPEDDFPRPIDDHREDHTKEAVAGYAPVRGRATVYVDAPSDWRAVYGALPAHYRQVTFDGCAEGERVAIAQEPKKVGGVYYFKDGRRPLFAADAKHKTGGSVYDALTGTRLVNAPKSVRNYGHAARVLEIIGKVAQCTDKEVDDFLIKIGVDPAGVMNGKEIQKAQGGRPSKPPGAAQDTPGQAEQKDAAGASGGNADKVDQVDAMDGRAAENTGGADCKAEDTAHEAQPAVTVDTFDGELFVAGDVAQDAPTTQNALRAAQDDVRAQNKAAIQGLKTEQCCWKASADRNAIEGAWHKCYLIGDGEKGNVFAWHGKWWGMRHNAACHTPLMGPFATAAGAINAHRQAN